MARRLTVENLVKRLTVDIPQYNIKILAKRYITIAVNDEAAHDTLTS